MSEKNGYATRDSFRAATGRRYTVTDNIPPFGKVPLRSISEREKRLIASKSLDENGQFSETNHAQAFAWACIYMVLDKPGEEGGEPMFSEALDLEWLCEIDYASSAPLMQKLNQHAEIGPYQQSLEDLKKSLSDTRGLNGGSTAPTKQTASTSSK